MKLFHYVVASLLLLPTQTFAQTVTIGTATQYDVGEYTVDAATLQGFDNALGEMLCERAKLSCTWKVMDRDILLPALKSKEIDIMIAAFPVTAEFGDGIEKTAPYLFPDPFTSVSLAGSQTQMHGNVKSVATTPSPAIDRWHATTGYTMVFFETLEEAMKAAENGQADIAMGEYEKLVPLMDAHKGKLKFVRDNRRLRPGVAMAFHADNVDLRFTFEDHIYDMTKDGSLNEVTKEWFGIDAIQW